MKSEEAAEQLIHRLNAKGLSTRDASSIEAVQVRGNSKSTIEHQAA